MHISDITYFESLGLVAIDNQDWSDEGPFEDSGLTEDCCAGCGAPFALLDGSTEIHCSDCRHDPKVAPTWRFCSGCSNERDIGELCATPGCPGEPF